MQKNFTFSETINYPIETVWQVLSKPSKISVHGAVKSDIISDTEWVEHTNDSVDNHCKATLNEAEKRVEIKSENSSHKGEWDDIIISAKDAGNDSTEITVGITVATKAIFNMLAFKYFGDKISKYSSNNIFSHIENLLK